MSFCASLIPDKKILQLFFLFQISWLYPQAVDSALVYRIGTIAVSGNKKTKERIITRELARQSGDTMTLSNLTYVKKRSEQNIFNTQLFIYDTIYSEIDHERKIVDLNIAVKERWYIWPVPVLEVQDRNFNTWWKTKDLFRINYGFALGLDNFTGVKDRLVLLFQRGYTEKYGFSYRLPYLNKAQTLGFNLLYVFSRNNEVTYKTEENVPLFVRQYNQYLRTEHEAKAGIIHRPNLYEQTTLEAVVKSGSVKDTVVQLNPDYYGRKASKIAFASLQYRYTFDDRDNKVYPLAGWAFDLWANQDGFDFSGDSPVNILSLASALRKHTKLGDRVYLANMVKGRLMNVDHLSFNFNRALGWNDMVRGYEYYVIDGQRYFLTRNCLRYQIIKPRVFSTSSLLAPKQFNTIPYYAFVSLFFDAAYVEDKFYYKTNDLTNAWQYGYGAGLDFISYYDLVLRFEYSFNRLKQSGFFIHMTSGF
jgi:outer membrane protein assembly factor BamA